MNKVVFFVAIICALFYQFVDAGDECKGQFKKLRQAFQEATAEDNAPDCYKQYGLDRFRGSDDEEDENEDRRQHKELVKYLKNLSEEEEKKAKECMHQVGRMAFEKVGHEITEKCMEELKEMGKKIEAE
ncbi:uncharacterized protein NPIL_581341 [Nephila pilipes]|uniref:Uncharacterized protein n=1 Tax=Nephila pilipes TaxID=299642 RepID=A0A8X6QAV3_NEPPI|nr:uncharacterized protein NPIL_581341 [Nephila pilipes]